MKKCIGRNEGDRMKRHLKPKSSDWIKQSGQVTSHYDRQIRRSIRSIRMDAQFGCRPDSEEPANSTSSAREASRTVLLGQSYQDCLNDPACQTASGTVFGTVCRKISVKRLVSGGLVNSAQPAFGRQNRQVTARKSRRSSKDTRKDNAY